MRYLSLPKGVNGDITLIFVMILIVTLVLLAALLYPEYNIFTRIASKTPYDICRESVEATSFMRVKDIELSPFLKCKTEQITLAKNDPEFAKQTIADALYNCYYQFARGEKELFSGDGRFCFVCSTIDFDGEGAKIKELPTWQKYLFETRADNKNTFAQYLYKDKASMKKERMQKDGTYTTALSSQKMGVIFIYDRFNADLVRMMREGRGDVQFVDLLDAARTPFEENPIEALGSSLRVGTTRLLTPYSAEEINHLGCTQKIAQKPS